MTRTRIAAALLTAAVLPLAACGGGADPLDGGRTMPVDSSTGGAASAQSVTVGSADFPESALLAEIYAQALEGNGLKVDRSLNIGSRETYLKAITDGEVDLLPEYTGSLLNYYDKAAKVSQADEVYAALQQAVPSGLTVLTKSAAEDKNSIAVTKATADEWSLKAIPDLAAHQGELSIMAAPEFKTRQQGLVGLKAVYNITPAQFRPQSAQAAVVDALKNGQVKAANIYSTDPAIGANDFVVLDDPQRLFGSDNVVPLVRAEKADLVRATLDAVSAKLDTPTLADLVAQVVGDKKDAAVVAKEWLTAAGLA